MSSTGTNPVTSGLESIWGGVETWAQSTASAASTFLVGLAGSVTASQFAIIGKAAQAFKTALAAGATQASALQSAWASLSAAEIAELDSVELSLVNFIIQLSGTAPAV